MTTNAAIMRAAHKYLDGWTYKLVAPDASKRETNCCIATEKIVEEGFGVRFDHEQHADAMIMDGGRPMSPIDAVVESGIGFEVRYPIPGRIHYMQTWRVVPEEHADESWFNPAAEVGPLKSGHSKLYSEPLSGVVGDPPLVIQATYEMGAKSFLTVADFAEAVTYYDRELKKRVPMHFRIAALGAK